MRVHSARRPSRQVAVLSAAVLLAAALAGCINASDNDHDGILDVDDPDDDNDQVPDGFETQYGSDPLNATDAALDVDGDGLTLLQEYLAGTDPTNPDSDGDSMPDGWEVANGLDPVDSTDGAADLDGDGLTNAQEFANGTLPANPDTDGDGIPDGWEVAHGLDPNAAGDGGLDPDHDGLTSAQESAHGTDPLVYDTDNDTMGDGWEWGHGLNPLDPSDADEDPDGDSYDLDGSGTVEESERFTNIREFGAGTDPQQDDTDADGCPDGFEWGFGLDPTNPDDATQDPDGDGLSNVQEATLGTAPNRTDSDGDSMPDGWEYSFGLNPADAADAAGDADGDGLTNAQEYSRGSDPTNPDTDGDGAADGLDADPTRDLSVTVRVTGAGVTLATAGGEGAFDPPWELLLRVTIGGTAAANQTFNLTGATNLTGSRDDLNLTFTVDVDDGAWDVSVTVELWELDLAETVGVNADDLLDIDPTGANFTLAFTYNLTTGAISGEVTGSPADGSQDGRVGEADGRIDFEIGT